MTRFFTRLTRELRHSDFGCGNDELDRWFHRIAMQAQGLHTARTFVLVDDAVEGGSMPLAFYSLAAHSVIAAELPESEQKRMPISVPAALLARLGVHRDWQGGKGIGPATLRRAVRTVIDANQNVACGLMVVDAIDERAEAFYRKFAFVSFDSENRHRRLFARVDELEQVLALGEPT